MSDDTTPLDDLKPALPLAEVVIQYPVSTSTLRRLLREEKLPSAYQERSPKGLRWMVFPSELEALGYRPHELGEEHSATEVSTTAPPTADVEDLRARLRAAEEQLAAGLWSTADSGSLRADLEAARAEVTAARADLATARAERDRAEREAELSRQAADLMAAHLDDLRGALARIPLATARGIGNAAAAELEVAGTPRRKWWRKAR